jgi:hypothetical protein
VAQQSSGDRPEHGPRLETGEQRLDRNLNELLNELRVALPGVQVLFAFLLVVPFNQRFAGTSAVQLGAYLVALVLTAAASVFLIAPSIHHRLQFRLQEKQEIVLIGNRLAVVGLTLLALAIVSVVFLVTDFLFGHLVGTITTGAVAALCAVVWYAIPMRRLVRRG